MSDLTASELEQLRAKLAELTYPNSPLLVVVDHRGFIVQVDASLAVSLGWEPSALVGRPLSTMIPARFRDAHHLGFARFLATSERVVLDRRIVSLTVLHRDGRELAAEHVIIAVPRPDGLLFAASIRVEPL